MTRTGMQQKGYTLMRWYNGRMAYALSLLRLVEEEVGGSAP